MSTKVNTPYVHHLDSTINIQPSLLVTVSIHLSPHSSILPLTKGAGVANCRWLSSGDSRGCPLHTFSFSAPASAGIPSRIWRTRKADSGLRDAPRRLHRPPQPSGPRVRLIFLGGGGGARGRRGAVPGLGGAAAARAAEAGGRAAPRGLRALSAGAGPLRARGARGCARVRSWALAAAAAVPLSQQTPPPASPPAWPCPEEPSILKKKVPKIQPVVTLNFYCTLG
uniref:uncharacterized protein LOC118529402 n=1 Tax=Halichoerus grypus TaxID=9711 RepID=UPI001658CA3E|nr:uncharacterized protein LOC118529402 [Halichoerus grypus]